MSRETLDYRENLDYEVGEQTPQINWTRGFDDRATNQAASWDSPPSSGQDGQAATSNEWDRFESSGDKSWW